MDGQVVTRVVQGVGLAEGWSMEDDVLGIASREGRVMAVRRADEGDAVEVWVGEVGGTGPRAAWTPPVAPPLSCTVAEVGDVLLPPLLGADGAILLAVAPVVVPHGVPSGNGHWLLLEPLGSGRDAADAATDGVSPSSVPAQGRVGGTAHGTR